VAGHFTGLEAVLRWCRAGEVWCKDAEQVKFGAKMQSRCRGGSAEVLSVQRFSRGGDSAGAEPVQRFRAGTEEV
jgi:hypothetical protein